MKDSSWQIAYVVATVILAGVAIWGLVKSDTSESLSRQALEASKDSNSIAERALSASGKSNEIAQKALDASNRANDIADRSLKLNQQANMPLISAYYNSYSDSQNLQTERITINNDGGKVGDFQADAYFFMRVTVAGKTVDVPIIAYFIDKSPTLMRQGPLMFLSYNGNYSKYLKIYSDFRDAAKKDGFNPSITESRILKVTYTAANLDADSQQNGVEEYFRVYSSTYPDRLTKDTAETQLNTADKTRTSAANSGLTLYVWDPTGSQLWNWLKNAFLE